jgi:hypothetical protein
MAISARCLFAPAGKRQERATSPARASRAGDPASRTWAAAPSWPAAAAGPCSPPGALLAAEGQLVSSGAAPWWAKAKRVWLPAPRKRAVTPSQRHGAAAGRVPAVPVGAPVPGQASGRVRGRALAAPRRRALERSRTSQSPRNRRPQAISRSSETLGQALVRPLSLFRYETSTFCRKPSVHIEDDGGRG